MMNKDKKKSYIEEMKVFFKENSSILITHYQGLSVKQIDELRSEMRKHGILFKITKNRITKLALEGSKYKKLESDKAYFHGAPMPLNIWDRHPVSTQVSKACRDPHTLRQYDGSPGHQAPPGGLHQRLFYRLRSRSHGRY